jgi:prophage regulatory protein
MATLEEQFNTRIGGFLDDTGMAPTTLGMLAVGDPNLLREIERGRSLTLRTADRVVAFIDSYELAAGGAEAPPARPGRPRPAARAARARNTKRSEAMGAQPSDRRTNPPIRLLRISEVAARTGLGRSTIYEWSADGRFPPRVRLGGRVARWVEAEVDEWLRKWL